MEIVSRGIAEFIYKWSNMVFKKMREMKKVNVRQDSKGTLEMTIPKKSIPENVTPQNTAFNMDWVGGNIVVISGNPASRDNQNRQEFATNLVNSPIYQPLLLQEIAKNPELVKKIVKDSENK